MKRSLLDAQYGSSDESDGGDGGASPKHSQEPSLAPTRGGSSKRPKLLPALSDALTTPVPIDDPSLHQGRQRSRPHVEGQFAAHVYVPVSLNKRLKLTLQNTIDSTKESIPETHSLLGGTAAVLHISLSRPIFLRDHQRDDFRSAVKAAVRNVSPFEVSFAKLTTFSNDEKTRTFLSVEVGAGHGELKGITDALTPHIQSLRQEPYYTSPRFHISIAWALLNSPPKIGTPGGELDTAEAPPPEFPSISEIPAKVVDDLETKFGGDIRATGRCQVEVVEVKIGKVVSSFHLA